MGEHKKLRCHDCQQYTSVGKLHQNIDGGAGNSDMAIHFLTNHQGHHVELVGEYGGTQERWLNTYPENGWVEVTDD